MKKCRICNSNFKVKSKYGGGRQFCYSCVPEGLSDIERTTVKRQSMKQQALSLLGGACLRCGETRPYLIDFHHVDKTKKEHSFSSLLAQSRVVDYFKELEKAIPLCSNCHREFHYEESQNGVLLEDFVALEDFQFYQENVNREHTYVESSKPILTTSVSGAPLGIQPEDDEIQDYSLIVQEVRASSFEEVARRYGISGNALKKRLKARGFPYLMSEIRPSLNKKPEEQPLTWRELPIIIYQKREVYEFETGNAAIDFIVEQEGRSRPLASEGLRRVVEGVRQSYLGYTV